jgi:putative ABC transport system substrate-binding protein
MKRRTFIAGLGRAAVWPVVARAQQAMPAIGWLSSRTAATDALVLPAFHRALNAQGFVEGQNVSVEYRYYARNLWLTHCEKSYVRI